MKEKNWASRASCGMVGLVVDTVNGVRFSLDCVATSDKVVATSSRGRLSPLIAQFFDSMIPILRMLYHL
jgi:hypothetical protein